MNEIERLEQERDKLAYAMASVLEVLTDGPEVIGTAEANRAAVKLLHDPMQEGSVFLQAHARQLEVVRGQRNEARGLLREACSALTELGGAVAYRGPHDGTLMQLLDTANRTIKRIERVLDTGSRG